VKNFVPTVYGGFAFMFRIPTTIRKIKKDQHLSCLINTNESSSSLAARTTGGIAGLCTAGYVCFQAITEATKGNYLPLAVIGVANALSFAYELGRKELFGGK
jgi:hypothetical protein